MAHERSEAGNGETMSEPLGRSLRQGWNNPREASDTFVMWLSDILL
jgi:hypothetical protein